MARSLRVAFGRPHPVTMAWSTLDLDNALQPSFFLLPPERLLLLRDFFLPPLLQHLVSLQFHPPFMLRFSSLLLLRIRRPLLLQNLVLLEFLSSLTLLLPLLRLCQRLHFFLLGGTPLVFIRVLDLQGLLLLFLCTILLHLVITDFHLLS